jgi:hypothetical protein
MIQRSRPWAGACAALMLVTALQALAAPPKSVGAGSAWTNQMGSTLYIDAVETSGLLSGHYVNRAAGYSCQDIPYPVTGWINGTAITFTTLWQSSTESCNSITAWTGFYDQGQISTLWQLVANGATSPSQIVRGSDTFHAGTSTTHKSLLQDQ